MYLRYSWRNISRTIHHPKMINRHNIAGPLSAALTNRLGFRRVIILGSLVSSIGLTTSFFATSVESLFVTTGIITGLGFCMVYTPSVVAINFYFDRKKALATGIALCGSGVGMFIFAPLTTWLINSYGVRGTFLMLVCSLSMHSLFIRG